MASPTGMWTSVSGAMAQSQNVDTIANNLANVNTTGYKKDTATFKEYLSVYERNQNPTIDIPRTIFKDSDFYHTDGRENAMVNVNNVHTQHTQGSLKPTNGPFDLAIDGNGFFTIKGQNGIFFTRSGDFKIDGQGRLVNNDGMPVLAIDPNAAAQAAAPPAPDVTASNAQPGAQAARSPASTNPFVQMDSFIKLKPSPDDPNAPKETLQEINLSENIARGDKIRITASGDLYAGSTQIAKLAVADFPNAGALRKVASTLYSNVDAANVPRVDEESKVQQGFLEMSNVSAVSEIMDLLKANRMFESNMRAIRAYGEMSAKEANEVGKL